MAKRVLSVGQCGPDNAALAAFLNRHFRLEILQSDLLADTLATLRKQPVDLVLVNRKLDADYSDGTAILQAIKADPQLGGIPTMIVSNHAEVQDEAVGLGAERGFGKLEYADPKVVERLRSILGKE